MNEKIFSLADFLKEQNMCEIISNFQGELFVFGKGTNGQLGLGTSTLKNTRLVTPTRVSELSKYVIVSVALGSDYSMCLTSSGDDILIFS